MSILSRFTNNSTPLNETNLNPIVDRLPAARGASGQFLRSNGSTAQPSYANIAASDLPVGTSSVHIAQGDRAATVARPNNTTTFLRGDGAWAVPSGGLTLGMTSTTAAQGDRAALTARPNNTSMFLRGDGHWAVPPNSDGGNGGQGLELLFEGTVHQPLWNGNGGSISFQSHDFGLGSFTESPHDYILVKGTLLTDIGEMISYEFTISESELWTVGQPHVRSFLLTTGGTSRIFSTDITMDSSTLSFFNINQFSVNGNWSPMANRLFITSIHKVSKGV